MFLSEKQNLINYWAVARWTAVLVCLCFGVGVVARQGTGWMFALMQLYLVLIGSRSFFDWSPEPTAKRQIAVAIAVQLILGVAGYFLVNWLIGLYFTRALLWRG